jgi:formate hydrogenlyase subunit 4
MTVVLKSIVFAVCTIFLPLIIIGIIRKIKARMQNRIGASVFQPLFDMVKLLRKNQTVSETTTWIFQLSTAFNAAAIVMVASLVPWVSFKPNCPGDDLFLVVYLLAAIRFMTILSGVVHLVPLEPAARLIWHY